MAGNRKGMVIGVVGDFHFRSLRDRIQPLFMSHSAGQFLTLRVNPGRMPATMAFVEETWKQFIPHRPFRFTFLDQDLDRMYRTERKLGQACAFFSVLSLLVACLGLVGLAIFWLEQRTREIGIRKALGATAARIVALLARELTWLVVVANLIAWPVAYATMDRWLQGFSYRIELGPEAFILGGLLAIFTASGAVSYQALSAARSNPVDALRAE